LKRFCFQTSQTLQRAGKDDPDIYEWVEGIAHVEIYPDPDLPPPKGKFLVTNIIRHPYLIRYNTLDVASPVVLSNGKIVPHMFHMSGRHPDSRIVSIHSYFLKWEDIKGILTPFGLRDAPAQIILENGERDGDINMKLMVFCEKGGIEVSDVQNQLREFINRLTKTNYIACEVQFVRSPSEFTTSLVSSKLVLFVDKRVE